MKLDINQKFKQAISAHQEGELEEAERLYREILEVQPSNLDVNNNLGVILEHYGKLEEAEKFYKKAIELKPDYAEAYSNLSVILNKLNKFDEAIVSCQKAIEFNPSLAQAYSNLGNAFLKLNRPEDAIVNYNKTIELKPDYVETLYNLGITLQKLGRLSEAESSYKRAIELKPDYTEAYNNLGIILYELGRLEESILSYRKAIELKPNYAEAYNNLGNTQKSLRKLDEALTSYNSASAINSDIDYLMGALLNTKMYLCIWSDLSIHINKLIKKININEKVSFPFPLLSLIDDPSIHRKAAEIYSTNEFPKSDILPKIPHYNYHKRIRIGYFSSDFNNHPVSYLTAALYETHDRKNFEIHAFSLNSNKKDEFNKRIRVGVDYFHDVQMMSDRDIVMLSRSLEIDIAIDLTGFTENCRLGIFAMSAAPIQVGYLGYAGTMGANYMNYLIADKTIIPERNKKYYLENIIYLPCYQVNDTKIKLSKKIFSRKDFGLPINGFVFCCFNSHYKINPNIFSQWMKILSQVDKSVLWLPAGKSTVINNLKKEAKKNNINENRLIFAPILPLKEDHMRRIQLADLFLDTLPFNAHTTASDALRMGVPILTCKGESFPSRIAASLLKAVNLPELITTTLEQYESLAIDLAKNPKKLKIIKDKLINNLPTAPLFNTLLFTQNLESAYKIIYENYQNRFNLNDIKIN